MMRIGKFAERYQVSMDTIRHYMDLGLLLPEKQGGQYSFDERCRQDIEEILELKEMGFLLHEIKNIFMLKSLGKMTPYQEDEYYLAFFHNKLQQIELAMEKLTERQARLAGKLTQLMAAKSRSNFTSGIDLRALQLFRCLKCGGDLLLAEGQIQDNQVMDGRLNCACGEDYNIEAGILRACTVDNQAVKFKCDYQGFIPDYIDDTDPAYLDKIYKGLEWIYKRIDVQSFHNKVILELGTGLGFFLRYMYNALPEDSIYIAVDHDITRHEFLKRMLERADCRKTVLFIQADFLQIPIKDRCVDILMDYSGSSNYSFTHTDFLLTLVDHLVKEHAVLYGSYILFQKFGTDNQMEEKHRKLFKLKQVKEQLAQLQYKMKDEHVTEYVEKGGKYEDYFVSGEQVYSYLCYGER